MHLLPSVSGPINGNQTSVSGTDIKYSGLFETGVGDFDVNVSAVVMDEYYTRLWSYYFRNCC